MVSFGNASGPVDGVNLGILAAKGSLFVTRPTLATHVPTLDKMKEASDEMFVLVAKKKIQITIGQRFALEDAGQAQDALQGRKTTGATILTLD
jgi:NADPH2:quinone reductase